MIRIKQTFIGLSTGAFINVTVTRTYTNDEDDLIKDTKYTNDFISDWLDESNDIDELYSVI